jgi:murein DD-endopeptidase MepM/ murein hydrolase activator NlpD
MRKASWPKNGENVMATPEPEVRFARLPVDGPITGKFGDVYVINGRTWEHLGVDFGVPVGTPVFAPAAGEIVPFVNDGSFGIGVCIRHSDGWHTLYAHLSRADVATGARVGAGQRIGATGATGFVTGPHLHWQLCASNVFPRDRAVNRDPLRYMMEGDDMDEATVRRIVDQRLAEISQAAGLGTPDLARGIGAIWARLQAVAKILDRNTPPPPGV